MIRPVDSPCLPRPAAAAEPVGPAEGRSFRAALTELKESERELDARLQRALDERSPTPSEMLELQLVVQRFQLGVETAARVGEQLSQAIRTLTRPQ